MLWFFNGMAFYVHVRMISTPGAAAALQALVILIHRIAIYALSWQCLKA
jgi:hypothetical protein